jgi:hypothetical protein
LLSVLIGALQLAPSFVTGIWIGEGIRSRRRR